MKIGNGLRLLEYVEVKDNAQYVLRDNRDLKNLVVSETVMKPNQSTNGHKHEGLEEVYIFTGGSGAMLINYEMHIVSSGDIVSIPAGAFHKVRSGPQGLTFISIFEAYDRQ